MVYRFFLGIELGIFIESAKEGFGDSGYLWLQQSMANYWGATSVLNGHERGKQWCNSACGSQASS